MFCENCGKKLEDDWKKCPYCGTKKKRKKWPFILGGAAVILVIFFVLIFIGDKAIDKKNEEALAYLQSHDYGKYKGILLKDVLEYTWKDGKWDSFEAEDDGTTVQVVEYAEDTSRETMIQFVVDVEADKIDCVNVKFDGENVSTILEAEDELDKMYAAYIMNKMPWNDTDMSEFAGEDVKELAKKKDNFYTEDELIYADFLSKVVVTVDENEMIDFIGIQGPADYSPVFLSLRIGDQWGEDSRNMLEKAGYTVFNEDSASAIFYETNNRSELGILLDENGKISQISWMKEFADGDIDSFIMEKEEESRQEEENRKAEESRKEEESRKAEESRKESEAAESQQKNTGYLTCDTSALDNGNYTAYTDGGNLYFEFMNNSSPDCGIFFELEGYDEEMISYWAETLDVTREVGGTKILLGTEESDTYNEETGVMTDYYYLYDPQIRKCGVMQVCYSYNVMSQREIEALIDIALTLHWE